MARSKAVYFTRPKGEPRVSCSALLCKVTKGMWQVPCCHPWLALGGPVGAERQSPPWADNSDRSLPLASHELQLLPH